MADRAITLDGTTFTCEDGRVNVYTAAGDWVGTANIADGEALEDAALRYRNETFAAALPAPSACANCGDALLRTSDAGGNVENAMGVTISGWWGGWRDFGRFSGVLCGRCCETLIAALPGLADRIADTR